jgi:hypothetical protein
MTQEDSKESGVVSSIFELLSKSAAALRLGEEGGGHLRANLQSHQSLFETMRGGEKRIYSFVVKRRALNSPPRAGNLNA